MNITNALAFLSVIISAGLGIYFMTRKIFGGLGIFIMMFFTLCISGVSVSSGLRIVIIGYLVIELILCVMCFIYEMTIPGKNKSGRKRSNYDSDDDEDEDEYISTAPTMSVRQIVNEYTKNPQEAEAKYTDKPMNVTGLITKINMGGKHSHVELDEMFMCICPQGSVRSLKPLQKVCITGTLRGKYLLDDCVMVKRPL